MHNDKLKKPVWKDYVLHDSNQMTFWKRQNFGDIKTIGHYQGWASNFGAVKIVISTKAGKHKNHVNWTWSIRLVFIFRWHDHQYRKSMGNTKLMLKLYLWGKSPAVQLLGCRADLFLTLWGISTQLPFASTWMQLEGIMLSEISESEDKHYMVSFVWGI